MHSSGRVSLLVGAAVFFFNLITEIENRHMAGINYIVLCILFILPGLKITGPVDCVCINIKLTR